jgi:uncharacterized protein (TIGR02246 family)
MNICRTTRFAGLALQSLSQLGCRVGSPQIDLGAEKQTIDKLTDQWAEAEGRRDLSGSLAVIWEDAVWLPPGGEVVTGIESIGVHYQDFFDQVPYTSLSVEPSQISVSSSGDAAYTWANFSLGFEGTDGTSQVSLKFLTTCEKRDGQWKVSANMFNYNAPQTGG